jgi:ketosteroid isomerase-like protein
MRVSAAILVLVSVVACVDKPAQSPASDAGAGIDSLNARITQAYRNHDPKAYGTLFTDTAVFEWPNFHKVEGQARLEEMARDNWASLRDMDLKLKVTARRFASDHATEFGSFEQSWRDSSGGRMTEFGRYVEIVVRKPDNTWRIDRFFGFEDSTRAVTTGKQ